MVTNTSFKNFDSISNMIESALKSNLILKELDCGEFETMRYPKSVPFMKLNFKKYAIKNFGCFSILKTKALFSIMQLTTAVFTPNFGSDVPFLLIDIMKMGKKRAVFIEYYDLTKDKKEQEKLSVISSKYKKIEDYNETQDWYIKERTDYSLIKGGNGENDNELLSMLKETVSEYSNICKNTVSNENKEVNLKNLSEFINRMVKDGNPSSKTLEKILGKEKAELFFRNYVMPNKYEEVK